MSDRTYYMLGLPRSASQEAFDIAAQAFQGGYGGQQDPPDGQGIVTAGLEQHPVGQARELGDQVLEALAAAGETMPFIVHESPAYEWLGVLASWHPDLGWNESEADDSCNAVISHAEIRAGMDAHPDEADLRQWLWDQTGGAWPSWHDLGQM